MTISEKIQRYGAIALAFALGLLGLWGFLSQWAHCRTIGQSIQVASQFLYGGIGVTAGLVVLAKRVVPRIVEALWILTLVLATGLAPVVWANGGMAEAVTSAFGGSALSLGAVWLLRRAKRSRTSR